MDIVLFRKILIGWIAIAIGVFILLFFISAPYGRFVRKNWGPMIPNKYGWLMMEFPSLFTFCFFFISGHGEKNIYLWIIAGLYMMHYVNRTFVFPFRIQSRNKLMPISVSFMAIIFNLVNGSFNGYYLGNFASGMHEYGFSSPMYTIGLILFLLGAIINIYSDEILMRIKRNAGNGYKIPRGGLFNYISCPNYFGEMIEWLGFALMANNLAAFSFFIWTIANLAPRARANHRWYLEKFEDYPKKRKALVPFLF